MDKILAKWIVFMAYWRQTHTKEIDGQQRYVKPEFYDFMQWLVDNF